LRHCRPFACKMLAATSAKRLRAYPELSLLESGFIILSSTAMIVAIVPERCFAPRP
jgi:hypothetical protein